MQLYRTRWVILALVFAAAILNYIDRQIIAVLKPEIEAEFGWSDRDYAHLASAFQFSAAIAYLGVGWFIDRVGLRSGYAWAVSVWSLAAAAHALARNVFQFTIARIVLGASEAVHTPAAVKAVAVWFPKDVERSTALGLMASAGNIGTIITPLLIPLIAVAWGWRAAFVIAGSLGLVWTVAWLMVRVPKDIRARELPPPEDAALKTKVPWSVLLRSRPAWAIAGAKFLFDMVWWFVLFWMPDFFNKQFGLSMAEAGLPVALIYTMAAFGSAGGGWITGRLLARGVSLNSARKLTMLGCALCVVPIVFATQAQDYWTAALIIGFALAAHQGFSTNVFGLCTDLFPPAIVGSVVSFGALAGNIGGMLILEFAGYSLDVGWGYMPMFVYASVAYLLALGWIHLMVPRMKLASAPTAAPAA